MTIEMILEYSPWKYPIEESGYTLEAVIPKQKKKVSIPFS